MAQFLGCIAQRLKIIVRGKLNAFNFPTHISVMHLFIKIADTRMVQGARTVNMFRFALLVGPPFIL